MEKRTFNITISTPIGKRSGVMAMNIEGGEISGTLSIFGGEFEISGKMLDAENCIIYGMFKTLVNEFYYQATGHIDNDSLTLTMNGGSSTYKLAGTRKEQQP